MAKRKKRCQQRSHSLVGAPFVFATHRTSGKPHFRRYCIRCHSLDKADQPLPTLFWDDGECTGLAQAWEG